jgi:hypothetical protein
MAACNPATIIAQGSAFQGLSPLQVRMAQVGLLCRWLLAADPGADVSPNGIMRRSTQFFGLSDGQVRMLTLQQLCNLSKS